MRFRAPNQNSALCWDVHEVVQFLTRPSTCSTAEDRRFNSRCSASKFTHHNTTCILDREPTFRIGDEQRNSRGNEDVTWAQKRITKTTWVDMSVRLKEDTRFISYHCTAKSTQTAQHNHTAMVYGERKVFPLLHLQAFAFDPLYTLFSCSTTYCSLCSTQLQFHLRIERTLIQWAPD